MTPREVSIVYGGHLGFEFRATVSWWPEECRCAFNVLVYRNGGFVAFEPDRCYPCLSLEAARLHALSAARDAVLRHLNQPELALAG
jgi:hypothetical protein